MILGDGKLEMCKNIIIDEKGTPDACRVFLASAYESARKKGKLCDPLDKEYVRNWCRSVGINPKDLDPEDPAAIEFVHSKVMPDNVRQMTTMIYRFFAWKLFGMKLERFQNEQMGIDVEDRKMTVEIVVGSESDLPQLKAGLLRLEHGLSNVRFRVSVFSCHRNQKDEELPAFVRNHLTKADVVIAAAGKAAQLPADIKVKLCLADHPEIPVIGVALKGKTFEDDRDAVGSIKGLPGQPVEMDPNGEPYFGPEGFEKACMSAVDDEFLPKPIETKPAKIGEWVN